MKTGVFVLTVFSIFSSLVCQARVDLHTTKIMNLPNQPSIDNYYSEINTKISPKNVNNKSAEEVAAEVADNSVSMWWESTPLRNTAVGKAADAAEKKLNVKAEFEDKNKVKHTMAFKILAMQALARLEYKGWVQAAISYDAKASKAEAEMTEKISEKQDFLLSHSITKSENKSQVGFRWNW